MTAREQENDMVAAASTSWLDPFLASWRPGTGEPREIREPASGRSLLTIAQSTVGDVAEAARRAKAAQPAWAATSYDERARILRRAAEIYEAHRPEFGSWTQRETGAVHSKMHHEQSFAVGELHAAATMPFQPYGQLVPSVVPGRHDARNGSSQDVDAAATMSFSCSRAVIAPPPGGPSRGRATRGRGRGPCPSGPPR